MSILIKGLGMPKDCISCRWHHRTGVCVLTGMVTNTGRDCPLVEVPTPHGRLIDADDAFIDADERGFDFWSCDADIDSAQEFLRAQPTIIEAEEGEPDVTTN